MKTAHKSIIAIALLSLLVCLVPISGAGVHKVVLAEEPEWVRIWVPRIYIGPMGPTPPMPPYYFAERQYYRSGGVKQTTIRTAWYKTKLGRYTFEDLPPDDPDYLLQTKYLIRRYFCSYDASSLTWEGHTIPSNIQPIKVQILFSYVTARNAVSLSLNVHSANYGDTFNVPEDWNSYGALLTTIHDRWVTHWIPGWSFYNNHPPYDFLPTSWFNMGGISQLCLKMPNEGTSNNLMRGDVPNPSIYAWFTKDQLLPLIEEPVASFTYSPPDPMVGDEITFNASSSYDPDGYIGGHNWDFGDGDSAWGEMVTHAYAEDGDYTIRLTVTDNYGLTDSVSKVVEVTGIPPIASFELLMEREFELLDLEFPMVGGKIIFDASDSDDPDGEIINYEWNFGDGTTINTSFPDWDPDRDDVIYHVYQSPGEYTVTLTVTDDEGETDSDDTILDLTLEVGDLLLCRSEKSWVPGEEWTHVGMYVGDDEVVEAVGGNGVIRSSLSSWSWPNKTYVRALSVATADPQIREKAVQFAKSKVGQPYDYWSLVFLKKQEGGERWYCSELVWAAYLSASNDQIDLDSDLCAACGDAISPYEIDLDADACIIGEHKELKPATKWDWDIMWGGVVYSPVDLTITDPDGLILSKQESEIPGATYEEIDIDEDGELDDLFAIPERKTGDYLIQIIPEPGASPTDTYSLEVSAGGVTLMLADNAQIGDIPSQGYIIRSTEAKIEQIIPATIDFDPDTINLRCKGKVVTAYIELSTCYDVSQIDISSITLNEEVPALTKPTEVGDYDSDSVPDLMVKFDRSAVQNIISVGGQVEITITGQVAGTAFEGSDIIRVIDKGGSA